MPSKDIIAFYKYLKGINMKDGKDLLSVDKAGCLSWQKNTITAG